MLFNLIHCPSDPQSAFYHSSPPLLPRPKSITSHPFKSFCFPLSAEGHVIFHHYPLHRTDQFWNRPSSYSLSTWKSFLAHCTQRCLLPLLDDLRGAVRRGNRPWVHYRLYLTPITIFFYTLSLLNIWINFFSFFFSCSLKIKGLLLKRNKLMAIKQWLLQDKWLHNRFQLYHFHFRFWKVSLYSIILVFI